MNGEIHGCGADLNVVALAQFAEGFGVDETARLSPLLGIDDVAQREFDVVVRDFHVHVGLDLKTLHHEIALHSLDLPLCALEELLSVLAANAFQNVGEGFHIAGISDGNVDLIPDVAERTRVIEDWSAEDLSVRELNGASAVLVAADPVADLHHACVEEADVDHVTAELVDLDAIAAGVHVSGEDGDAAGDAEQRFAKRDCQAGADQAEKLAFVLEDFCPEPYDCRDGENRNDGVGQPVESVMLFGRGIAGFDNLAAY